uniref:PsbP C-terminal domain-containing protein n=1 Tax=Kalanchoe fedtschenkoi TaxID=63787 RepID=A0A7N0T0X0_KALFE
MATLLSLPSRPSRATTTCSSSSSQPTFTINKRQLLFKTTASLCLLSSSSPHPATLVAHSESNPGSAAAAFGGGIVNTKSWFRFYGDGFAIRVPPDFADLTEPEDYNAGLSLYGDKAKTKTFAARFASPDGSEVVSVIIRPTNQLKITFLEAQDVTDLGSLRQAARLFVPGGATLSSARTIKIKEGEDGGYKTYYFYEFDKEEERFAVVAAVNAGRAFVAGAAAPRRRWDDDGVKLRSAAISMTLL